MIIVPQVLNREMLRSINVRLDDAEWIDGNATSGHQSALAKTNRQLPEASAEAKALGDVVLDALARTPLFVAAALPLKVYPPLFNRYGVGAAAATSASAATCQPPSS
jgi:PKHD-type hydroxylase